MPGEGTQTMTSQPDDAVGVLRSLWAAPESTVELDADCGPTKVCKNMELVSFDGLAEPGSDLGQAWRQKLAREGKLSTSGGSIRDLVLGAGGLGSADLGAKDAH
jgi:hypothetical protein